MRRAKNGKYAQLSHGIFRLYLRNTRNIFQTMKYFLILITALLLAGCSSLFDKSQALRPGMTQAQVREILGEPASVRSDPAQWVYYGDYKIQVVFGDDGKMLFFTADPLTGAESPQETSRRQDQQKRDMQQLDRSLNDPTRNQSW